MTVIEADDVPFTSALHKLQVEFSARLSRKSVERVRSGRCIRSSSRNV